MGFASKFEDDLEKNYDALHASYLVHRSSGGTKYHKEQKQEPIIPSIALTRDFENIGQSTQPKVESQPLHAVQPMSTAQIMTATQTIAAVRSEVAKAKMPSQHAPEQKRKGRGLVMRILFGRLGMLKDGRYL